MKSFISELAYILAKAADGSPLTTSTVTALFYVAFNHLQGLFEQLIFGERFLHFFDLIFCTVFISFTIVAVGACAYMKVTNITN